MTTSDLLQEALRYTKLGWLIFPTKPDKTPYLSQYSATSDPAQVRTWWEQYPDALIGCRVPEDQLMLDVDPRHGGDRTWEKLLVERECVFTGRAHASGRGDGGCHYAFLRPANLDRVTEGNLDRWAQDHGTGHRVVSKDGVPQPRVTSGIDIIQHKHRYTILPPSLHPATGKPYSWVSGPDVEPQEMWPWLGDLLHKPDLGVAVRSENSGGVVYDKSSPADWYSSNHTWADVLGPDGWMIYEGDGEDDGSCWRHPLATNPYSATMRYNKLFVYSTSTAFEPTSPSSPHGYTRFAAFALLNHGGDQSAAAKDVLAMMPTKTTASPLAADSRAKITVLGVPDLSGSPERVDGVQGAQRLAPVPQPTLPDELWEARSALAHIRQAARARLIAPDAVLAAVLARVCVMTDYRYVLPPVVGRIGSLNISVALVGRSGSGKGSALDESAALLGPLTASADYKVGEVSVGSGEGLVHAFFDQSSEAVGGKRQTVMQRARQGLLVRVDEGEMLGKLAKRTGQTTLQVLCQAFSGERLGNSYASTDKNLTIAAHDYRMGVIMAIQPEVMQFVFDEARGGTPQRFLFVATTDPGSPEIPPTHPGSLKWERPTWSEAKVLILTGDAFLRAPLDISADIEHEIVLARQRQLKGETEELDAHGMLVQFKVAALLAILDGRLSVDAEDWRLARCITDVSRALRSWTQRELRAKSERVDSVTEARAIRREVAVEEGKVVARTEKIERVAKRLAVHVEMHGPVTKGALRSNAVAQRDRDVFDLSLGLALDEGWLVEPEKKEGKFDVGPQWRRPGHLDIQEEAA